MLVISSLDYGGAERQVLAIAERLDRGRFDPRICSLAPHLALAEAQGCEVPVHVVAKRSRLDVTVVFRLARLLRRHRVELVHAFLFDAELASSLAARLAGVSAVLCSERGADYHVPWRHRIAFRLTRWLSSGLVANSVAGKRFSMRLRGLPDRSVHVVYNGVDIERFAPRPAAELRRSLGIGPDDHVVGMVATFRPQKNHPLFFQMAARILARHPDSWFVCVGSPFRGGQQDSDTYHREMLELVDRLGIGSRCLLLGARRDVAELYNVFDVAVLTSSKLEGTPNALLEAMASGVPVVATDIADNAIHVPDGEVGFIVPTGDAVALSDRVERLLLNAERRRLMGAAARRHAQENYSVLAMAERMAAVYESAVGRGLGASR